MPSIPNGPYAIFQKDQMLTMLDNQNASPVHIMPPTGNPGEQEWMVWRGPNGGVTLKNLKTNKYAGFEGEPDRFKPIVAGDQPTEFQLEPADQPWFFKLYTTGGNGKFYFDFSPLLIFPPRSALVPGQMAVQPWRFEFHGN